MVIIKNKIILVLLAALISAVLFVSLLALTAFSNKAHINHIAPASSNYRAQPQEVNVASVDTHTNSVSIQGKDVFNTVDQNLNGYVEQARIQQENQQYAEQQAQQQSEAQAPEQNTVQADSPAPAQVQNQGANLNGYEQQVLALINNIRTAHGLQPLAPSQALTNVARSRSADMLSRNYFSHYTPEGTNIFDLLRANGIGYRNGGENLAHAMPASAGSPQVFADAWMNSPSHRDNILRGAYGQVGIGIAENSGRRVVTTVFTN